MYNYNQLFNPHLRENFRNNYLNDPEEFTFSYYFSHKNSNDNKTNLWNKICSAMDWTDVACIGFRDIKNIMRTLKSFNGLNNSSLLFRFISTVFLLNKSIDNLWLGFMAGENKNKFSLFKGNKNIFHGKVLKDRFTSNDIKNNTIFQSADDNSYFSHIRSLFGAHASNGNKKTFIDSNNKIHKIRLFSSYPNNIPGGNIYSVEIYCNDSSLEKYLPFSFKINIKDILNFAISRYQSLRTLANHIDKFHKNIKKIIKSKSIDIKNTGNSLEELKSLKKYAKETKIMNSYYDTNIKDFINILKLFNTKNEAKHFNKYDWNKICFYINNVINNRVIKDYYNALNNVKFYKSNYIESINTINPNWSKSNKYHYDYAKVMNSGEKSLENENYSSQIYQISLKILISKHKLPKYTLNLSPKEVYLLIISKTFYKNFKINTKE